MCHRGTRVGVFWAVDVKWASRWDTYLQSSESTSIHWFSIVNSLIIVVFLSGMLGVILVRTLHRDITRYSQVCAHHRISRRAQHSQGRVGGVEGDRKAARL